MPEGIWAYEKVLHQEIGKLPKDVSSRQFFSTVLRCFNKGWIPGETRSDTNTPIRQGKFEMLDNVWIEVYEIAEVFSVSGQLSRVVEAPTKNKPVEFCYGRKSFAR